MGIQINGITDTISATDGSLAVSGQQITGVTDINVSGIVTSTQGYVVGTGASIFSPAANILTFGTNGSERVRVDSSGNLLVGTTTLGNNRRGVSIDSASINIANNSGSASLFLSALNTNVASNIGGIITFNAVYRNSDNDSTQIAYIKGLRETATENAWASYLSFETSPGTTVPVERMRIDSSGRVGIGITTPTSDATRSVHIYSGVGSNSLVRVTGNAGTGLDLISGGDGTAYLWNRDNTALLFGTNATERARIDSSGRLLVGASTARSGVFYNGDPSTPTIQLEGTTSNTCYSATRVANGSGDAVFIFAKARGTAVGNTTVVQSADGLGAITFQGADGSEFVEAARIAAEVDGTPGANLMPGRLVFSTTADGASSPTRRVVMRNNGWVVFGQDIENSDAAGFGIHGPSGFMYATVSNNTVARFNRQTSDGEIIDFSQDNAKEGSISVSGTTVSYNGAHLSRWTQLPGGAERTEILRGSVLSNTDEMCEWGDEANEQLNRMKVSDVEGDKNVSGVFQAWDDDDDTYTNDFYCAMTGDFIIRIGADVIVERGDLLMSAGDGTAKPQDDDIIRSKTIAKVTSTNVSCTYDDGSYCVPCVLMAC